MRKETKAEINGQQVLFDTNELKEWKEEWQGMPEFSQDDVTSYKSIIVHFASEKDLEEFAKLLNQKIYMTTKSIWYPPAEIGRIAGRVYISKKKE